jgi:nucleotide-binding universal stress UspA family protein
MLKQILIGVNGSEFSSAAMEVAVELAGRYGTRLTGLGIVDEPRLTAPQPVPLGATAFKQERDAAAVEAEHLKIEQSLAAFGQFCQQSGVNGRVEKQIGDPATILAYEAQRYDLVVVGKRHVPSEEFEQPSKTLERLLKYSPRPVLCVPAGHVGRLPALVAYDGSLQAAKALQAFAATGLAADRDVYVAAFGEQAQANAELARDFLGGHGLSPQLAVEASQASVAQRLLEMSRQIEAGMIVLGCYGQPRMREFLFGSVTKRILAETTVPLFLFH